VSPTPGLIAQISGFLITNRYKYATIYVDLYSRYGYVYRQKTASANEAVEGKKTFEAHALHSGVRIENYQTDNGIIRANLWPQACWDIGQGLMLADINAHHQYGVAE
jgi:hypothetical protein